MSRISVVIPALSDATLLAHCLAALAAQTRPADEEKRTAGIGTTATPGTVP